MVEIKAAKGYKLDDTPYQIEVKDGGTATLEITNRQSGSALIHKIDSVTGKVGSFSIENQKSALHQYVDAMEGVKNVEVLEFIDNGYLMAFCAAMAECSLSTL